MSVPKISIICPIYQAEKTIHRCVDSVLSQTFSDFELLLIDDGSSDASGVICDEYAINDQRVKVFHKDNGGVASARQMGIDESSGGYTIHIDSDDWVEPCMLSDLYDYALKYDADIVICDFIVDYGKYRRYKKSGETRSNSTEYLKDIIGRYRGYLWNKLIRRSCYESPDKINFIKGQNLFEDLIICAKILCNPRRVVYLDRAYYHYMQSSPYSYTHGRNMYRDRVALNNILGNILNNKDFALELILLKKIEAYTALQENVFTRKEFLSRYRYLKDIPLQWYGEAALNRALYGLYYTEYINIFVKEMIKRYIRRLLS